MYGKDIFKSSINNEDEINYLTIDLLDSLHKKSSSIINNFDYSIKHIDKATELEEEKIKYKKTLGRFSFYDDLDTCRKYHNIIENKLKQCPIIDKNSNLKKIKSSDIEILISNFNLDKDKEEFSDLIENILRGDNLFQFFLPPILPSSIVKWEDLSKRTFKGEIKGFRYFVKGKICVPIIIVIEVNEKILKYYTLDYFFTVWDYSIQLISGFFRDIEKDIVFINNKEYRKNQFLPEFVTDDGFFKNNEFKIKEILGKNLELTNGLIDLEIPIANLEKYLCKEVKEVIYNNLKFEIGSKFTLELQTDFEIFTIKKIFIHTDKSISFLYISNHDEFILKESNFNYIYILLEKYSDNNLIIKNGDFFDFSYKFQQNIKVKIINIFKNICSLDYFIKIDSKQIDLNGQKTNIFSIEMFLEMIEDKNKDNYKYLVEYEDIISVDDVFFTTDYLEESNKPDILLNYDSSFGKISFYSNKQNIFSDKENDIYTYKDKIECAMFRIRKSMTFALIDTSNKYLSVCAKEPVINALTNENYSSSKIKRDIQENLAKINKDNLINSEGSLLILNHNKGDTLNITHTGNSLVFLEENNFIKYKKKLFINSLGEITNGIGSKKSLKFILEKNLIKVNTGNKLTVISDGFHVRMEKNELILKGFLLNYEIDKIILKANNLPINRRHLVFIAISKLNSFIENLVFEFFPDYPKNNLTREQSYDISKTFKEICFSPIHFFLQVIEFFNSEKNKKVYEKLATRLDNPNKSKVISFLIDGLLRILNINTNETGSNNIKNFLIKLGLTNFFNQLKKELFILKNYKNSYISYSKYSELENDSIVKINNDQHKLFLKLLSILISFFDSLESDIKNVIYEIISELYNIDIKHNIINSYWEKKIKIFEPIEITKNQLLINKTLIKKNLVLDLEPLLKKFIISEPFNDDFSAFFYDIERTDYSTSLVCEKNKFNLLINSLDTKNLGIIEDDDILNLREYLLYYPKITKIQNYNKYTSKNKEFLDNLINKKQSETTIFISNKNLDSIFKKLGINRNF